MSVIPVPYGRPIVERIAQELFTRLQKLEAGAAKSGMKYTVQRPTVRGPTKRSHLDVRLTQAPPEPNPEASCIGNPPAMGYNVQFNIRVALDPSEDDLTPADEYLNTVEADVIETVCNASYLSGSYSWQAFEGLAINAMWAAREHVAADGGFDGINVPLIVTYRVAETDPYSLRS